jgi:hypothetical protein
MTAAGLGRCFRLGVRVTGNGPRAGSSGLVSLSGYLDGRCHGDMRSEQWLTWGTSKLPGGCSR